MLLTCGDGSGEGPDMPVCPNCGAAFLDGETHAHAPAAASGAGPLQIFLMVCGGIFIGLIVLLIGVCGGIR